jgi:hypothetical protein
MLLSALQLHTAQIEIRIELSLKEIFIFVVWKLIETLT